MSLKRSIRRHITNWLPKLKKIVEKPKPERRCKSWVAIDKQRAESDRAEYERLTSADPSVKPLDWPRNAWNKKLACCGRREALCDCGTNRRWV